MNPGAYKGLDSNRLTLAYFVISGLDQLESLEKIDAVKAIEWVYAQQVVPSKNQPSVSCFLLRFIDLVLKFIIQTCIRKIVVFAVVHSLGQSSTRPV